MKIYTKRELAMRYFPNSSPRTATNNLARWIARSPILRQQLKESGYRSRCRVLTAKQIKIIIDFLGDP